MRTAAALALSLLLLAAPARAAGPTVRFDTVLGDVDVRLAHERAPATVATFLRYVAGGRYDSTYVHRSVPGFVIQGGGFAFRDGRSRPVAEHAAPTDRRELRNARGTLAAARVSGRPRLSTSQWFFNLVDNPALDRSSDNYTVFARAAGRRSLRTIDRIAAQRTLESQLPVLPGYDGGAFTRSDLVMIRSVAVAPRAGRPARPFVLRPSLVSVARGRVTVLGVPSGAYVTARAGDGRRSRLAVAVARGGRVRLDLRAGRRPVTVTALPPGAPATSVSASA